MAKQIVQYKCEKCGTIYVEKSTAERCEEAHRKPASPNTVKPLSYHSIFVDKENPETNSYPDSILVMFENGRALEYSISSK